MGRDEHWVWRCRFRLLMRGMEVLVSYFSASLSLSRNVDLYSISLRGIL
jgi:hypothetical protein